MEDTLFCSSSVICSWKLLHPWNWHVWSALEGRAPAERSCKVAESTP